MQGDTACRQLRFRRGSEQQAMPAVTRVEFRPLRLSRILEWAGFVGFVYYAIYVGILGVSVLMAIDRGLSTALDNASTKFGVPVWLLPTYFLLLPLICVAVIFWLKRQLQPIGFIEIQENGLLIACYSLGPINLSVLGEWFPWGFAEWSNLAPAAVFRFSARKCIGLGLLDLDAFLASRKIIQRDDLVQRARVGPQWARIAMSSSEFLPIEKFKDLGLTALGLRCVG